MSVVVFAVGVLVIVASFAVMLVPKRLTAWGSEKLLTNWRFAVALLRLLLGAFFIATSPGAHWPVAIEVIGWLIALGGLLIFVIPLALLERMADYSLGLSRRASTLWGLAALAFGLLIGFASWPF